MARREIVLTTSDLSGDEGAETVGFSFDGAEYEIDLTKAEVDEFAERVATYIDSARRVPGSVRNRSARRRTSNSEATAVRAWAASNGIAVNTRGRISREVTEAYEAAQGS